MDTDPTDVGPFRLLFVCTGNTCRSPLAEVIARRHVSERGWSHVEVVSAGVGAFPGSSASEGSARAAARHGLDLSGHSATLLDAELVGRADLILTMSSSHRHRVAELGGGEKAAVITSFAAGEEHDGEPLAGGVPDPIGGPDEEYEETFQVLSRLIARSLERLEAVVRP